MNIGNCVSKILFVTIVFLFLSENSLAQMWKRYRYEVYGGLGTTNFLGELGGGKREPSRFMGLRDVDVIATRPVMAVGLRYKITEIFAANISTAFGILSGNDELSGEEGRKQRNMHFRSTIFQINASGIVHLILSNFIL